MNDFDSIIAAEKARDYQLRDQDQFVFDTLTAIQASRSRTLKRLVILIVMTVLTAIVSVQVMLLQSASFTELITSIHTLVSQKPHYLALFNVGLIVLILKLKQVRVF